MLSVRPTKTWILGACEKTFQKSYKDMCGSFAQRFSELASFCHRKKLRMKTGERMSPALRRLVKAISKECGTNTQGLGEKAFSCQEKNIGKNPLHQHLLPKGERRQQHLWLHLHQLENFCGRIVCWPFAEQRPLASAEIQGSCLSVFFWVLLEKKDMTK